MTLVAVEGGAPALLEKEKRLGPPAVNKVDSLTDGLNDREAKRARNGPGSVLLREGGREGEERKRDEGGGEVGRRGGQQERRCEQVQGR